MGWYRSREFFEAFQFWPDKPLPRGVTSGGTVNGREYFCVPTRCRETFHILNPGDWLLYNVGGSRPDVPDVVAAQSFADWYEETDPPNAVESEVA